VAAQIVQEVEHHQSEVHIRCKGCPYADACSIFDLIRLGAVEGTPIEVRADGPDEDATIQALSSVFDGADGI
jgi:phosphotransferase system HPr (HPr) family protein